MEFNRYFETPAGVLWISGVARIDGLGLTLLDVLVYPTTGARAKMGTQWVRSACRSVEEEIRRQGFQWFRVTAAREYGSKPERMISFTRSLR